MLKNRLYLAALLLGLAACANPTGPVNPSSVASLEQQEEQSGTTENPGRRPGTGLEK